MQQHKSLRNDVNLSLEGKREERQRMENLNLVNKNRTALSVMFSIEAEVRTRQDVNLRIAEFSELVIQSRLCRSIFHQWESVTRPEQLQAKTPIIVCLSVPWRHHLFQNTREPHFGLHVKQLFVKRGSPTDKQHKASAGPLQVLCVSRKKFLISNVCSNGANVHLVKPHKGSHFDHKRKEPCLNRSISFAFSPLVMTFIICSLFWNCFQAFSFLGSSRNVSDGKTKHKW